MRDEIGRLLAKGAAAQWSADTAIDWTLTPRRPFWLSARAHREAVSQLLHGERAALAACLRLAEAEADPAAQAFLIQQAEDERRHAAVYARYLDRIGGPVPRDTGFGAAIDQALAWSGEPAALVIACHGVLEAEKVRLQAAMARAFACPLLARINLLVARDEARHAAFGALWLADALPRLPPDRAAAILAWVEGLWFATLAVESAPDGTAAGLNPVLHALRRRYVGRNWARHRRQLHRLGLGPMRAAA